MAIKRRDFQKLSSTVQEFLLKLPDEETSARLRDNLLHALHFLQLYYRVLQNRDKNNDPLQWNIDHSLSPLTPFKEAPDKFEWEWINVDSQKFVRQSLPKALSIENFKILPQIILAIRDGDLNAVKQIVKQDPQAVNNTDSCTRDCLTYAVQFDKYDILKFLLSNGANVKSAASDSSTCLHRAVYKNNSDMVELLLENKANINAQDSFNRAPLHWSVVYASVDCLKVLLKYNPNRNIKDKDGMSPLMWACHLDRLEHLKLLSRLDTAQNKSANIIKAMELDLDTDGRTWVHWSVRKNEPLECLNFLINSETVLVRDKEGKTCLHVAAEQGAIQACKIILDQAGAKILNELDNKKQTPLHLATLHGHARAIKILLDNGADPNTKDITGASSIDYVTKRNLFFCNSIIEICMRNNERKNRMAGAGSSNSVASSFNGSESNLTPAPPTTPKTTLTRPIQHVLATTQSNKDMSGRPPRPIMNNSLSLNGNETSLNASQNGEFSKTAPASLVLSQVNNNTNSSLPFSNIPPSPPSAAKTRPNYRGGWTSAERVTSGSLRYSRASTRTSLASDDLEKYMNTGTNMEMNFGGSLNNIENMNTSLPIGANLNNQNMLLMPKPLPPPRLTSSNPKIFSRSQETGMSNASFDLTQTPSALPPPVKPRKSSSVASLNSAVNNNSNLIENQNKYNYNNNSLNENTNPKANVNNIHHSYENINSVHTNNKNLNMHFSKNQNQLHKNTMKRSDSINIEDISGDEDEVSIASVKGEGFASDLSDSEVKSQPFQLNQRPKLKKSVLNQDQHQQQSQQHSNLKRPTTPMDFRVVDHQKSKNQQQAQSVESAVKGIKYHQMNEQNGSISNTLNTTTTHQRFNEWDPFASSRQQQQQHQNLADRQKSPLKNKQSSQSQLQVPQQQNQSSFAHSFMNTDSSPRQSSGRHQPQKLQQMSPQQQAINSVNNNGSQIEMSSSANLDLMVSGQKLGGRKDLSPTNTPREANEQTIKQQQQQQQQRPYTRRLQPLDKLNIDPVSNNSLNNSNNESQFMRLKTSKTVLDRKKLEPINKIHNLSPFNNLHVDNLNTTGHSITENDNTINSHNFYINNDEELSISENTISSEKQQVGNLRGSKKKKSSSFNQNRKKLVEPIIGGNDEALKM